MNQAVRDAAIEAGCTYRQAEVLATYVESETIQDTAIKLNLADQTIKLHLAAARKVIGGSHTAAAVARLIPPLRSKN